MDLTVLVFSSFKDDKCGHVLSLREIVSQTSSSGAGICQECLICGQAIGFVQESPSLPASNKPRRFVYFKFGKVCYRLAVGERRENSSSSSWWSSLFQQGGLHPDAGSSLAQARIQTILNLSDEMKILCKGKMLYPKPDLDEEAISDHLIAISTTNWKTKAAPTLTVMGTPAATRRQWLETEKSYLQTKRRSAEESTTVWLIVDATIQFAQHILTETLRVGVACVVGGYRLLSSAMFGASSRRHAR